MTDIIISGDGSSSQTEIQTSIDNGPHPFTKEAAIEFIKRSPMNSWMKGVCLSRIDNEDAVDHPRLLMMKIMEYVEINLNEARKAKEISTVCALCQYGFEAQCIIFCKDEIMVCNPECEYYNSGYALKENKV